MKPYLYTLIIFAFLCSCAPSPAPVIATQAATAVGDEKAFVYEIPEWLRDPHVNVLMYKQLFTNPKDPYIDVQFVALLNPLTGEKFTTKLKDGQMYEWIDNQTIGFSPVQNKVECPSGMAYGYVLNLSTGVLLANDFGRYFCTAELMNLDTSYGHATYFDRDELLEFVSEPSDLYNNYGVVSPDGKTMVIIQNDSVSAKPNCIVIYDFSEKNKVGSFYIKDLNPIIRFVGEEHKIVYFEGNTPCILNWDLPEKECGLRLPDEYNGIYFDYLNDSATRIGFMYRGIHTTGVGGDILCLYGIFNGKLSCPMKELDIFRPFSYSMTMMDGSEEKRIKANSVIDAVYSPDERFVHFSYGEGNAGGHFFPSPLNQAVVGMDGEIFFELGLLEHSHLNISKWRPLP